MPGPLAPLLRSTGQALLKPGQIKPQCPVRINWEHPLTYGLLCYWIDAGVGFVVDLVTGRVATKPSAMSQPVTSTTPYGASNRYNVANNQLADPLAAANQALAAPYSIACGLLPLGSATGTGSYFGLADISGNDCVMFFCPTVTTFGISFGNTSSPNNFTFTANTFYVVVGSATGATAQSWWVNGIAQTNGTATSLFSGSGQHYMFGGGSLFNSATGSFPNGNVFFGATWQGRSLTQADAVQLYTDPYCFLVPLEPEMMIIQSPTVDVLSAQIWM